MWEFSGRKMMSFSQCSRRIRQLLGVYLCMYHSGVCKMVHGNPACALLKGTCSVCVCTCTVVLIVNL